MKHSSKILLFVLVAAIAFFGCEHEDDNSVPADIAINNFIWKGLNQYYLWQAEVPDLSDSRFADQSALNKYLYTYQNPQNLFQDLLNKPASDFPPENQNQTVDRFSVLFSDYNLLEGLLSGTTKNNGVDFALYYKDATRTTIIGVVRYILPNSNAVGEDKSRGDIIYAVNGTELTISNYQQLLGNDSYTLDLADYDNGNIIPNGRSVNLTKTVLSENPVYITDVIISGSHKIGYLMYNGFFPNFESQLNDAFGELKSQGITEFVLDLRYNSGGSIATATHLASMITGQFNGQVFAKEQWNAKLEDYYSTNPATLFNYFTNKINTGEAINSLNLTKIYVLTTKSTASASELVVNGLKPYINVVQIGDETVGKNVGSVTLYDSPTFRKTDINPSHRYAMQPLVLKIVNKVGFGDYINGLQPDDLLEEDFDNLGILGDLSEPLLSAAITRILGGGRMMPKNPKNIHQQVVEKDQLKLLENEMYLETIPNGFPIK